MTCLQKCSAKAVEKNNERKKGTNSEDGALFFSYVKESQQEQTGSDQCVTSDLLRVTKMPFPLSLLEIMLEINDSKGYKNII